MRMAHKISAEGLDRVYAHPSITESESAVLTAYARIDVAAAKRSESVIVDDVAEYFAMHPQQNWGKEDFPNCAPPLRECVIEWRMPEKWNIQGEVLDCPLNRGQIALVMTGFDVTDENRNDYAKWIKIIGGGYAECDALADILHEWLGQSRWIVRISHWLAPADRPHCGVCGPCGLYNYLFVDISGKVLQVFTTGPLLHHLAATEKTDAMFTSLHVGQLAISFMHCKNVARVDVTESEGPPDKWMRRQKAPVIRYHMLRIGPMREVLRTEGGSESNGIKKALHICRGHFANYSDEAPLFGKYTGQFWKPAHVRGAIEHGAVVKDYQVTR